MRNIPIAAPALARPLLRACALPFLLGALAACTSEPPPPIPFGVQPDAGPKAPLEPLREPHGNDHFTAEACADAWLTRHHLNQYGDPEGTMYPGGTPLFNERTGQRIDRLTWLFSRHADLNAECGPKK